MKKIKYLLLIIFFVGCPFVDAKTDFDYMNTCNSKAETDYRKDCQQNKIESIAKKSIIEYTEQGTEKVPEKVFPSFDILLLIDTSDSMEDPGYVQGFSTKGAAIEKLVNDLIKMIKKYDDDNEKASKEEKNNKLKTNSKISYILTKSINSTTLLYDRGNSSKVNVNFTYPSTSGNTLLQDLWKKAYAYYNRKGLSNTGSKCHVNNTTVPIVVMFTDGYPNSYSSDFNAYNDDRPVVQKSSVFTEFSSLYAYSTANTMISFVKSMCDNVKIFNFGIGMHSADAFAKYILNPNSANRGNLSNLSQPATVSMHLNTLVSGGRVYDATAFIGGSSTGIAYFGGEVGEITEATEKKSGKKTVTENKTKSTITYKTYFTGDAISRWDDNGYKGYLYLAIPNDNNAVDFKKIERVEYKNQSGKFVSIKSKYIVHEHTGLYYPNDTFGELHHYTIGIKKAGVKSPGSVSEIRIVFNKKISFSSFGVSRHGLGNADSVLKDKVSSYVGGDVSAIGEMLQSIKNITITNERVVDGKKRTVTKVEHTSCRDFTIPSSKFFGSKVYVKVSKDDYYYVPDNPDLPRKSCVQIDTRGNNIGSISGVITETLTMNPNGPRGSSIYAGGGFEFGGPTLTSDIKWYFGYLSNNSPVVNITGQDIRTLYLAGSKLPNGTKIPYDVELRTNIDGSYSFDELYKDSECMVSYNSGDLNSIESDVWNSIKKGINKKFKFEGKVTSNDWNDSNSTASVPLITSSPSYNGGLTDVSLVKDNDIFPRESSYKITIGSGLKTAYIDSKTAEVIYRESSSDSDSDSSLIKVKKDLYYVPLDYPDNKAFTINYAEGNYSLIGIDNSFSNICSIKVKNTIYDVPDPDRPGNPGNPPGKINLKYHYRPIDVSNPFPKGNIFPNWVGWYQEKSNQNRLSNTYTNSPLYSITFSNGNGDSLSSSDPYYDWSSIGIDGSSSFVSSFQTKASSSSYCGLGKFEEKCDGAR